MVEGESTLAVRSMWALGHVFSQVGGHGWIWGHNGAARWQTGVAVGVTAIAGLALAATIVVSAQRGGLKPPWLRGRRKKPLSKPQWQSFFTPEGKLSDGGVKFLKIVRNGGVDPSLRAEVWPFLLGVYDLSSTEEERNAVRTKNRELFSKLRKQCMEISVFKTKEETNSEITNQSQDSALSEDLSETEQTNTKLHTTPSETENSEKAPDSNSPDLNSDLTQVENSDTESVEKNNKKSDEDFTTWQRIIRLDALRANAEWVPFSPSQADISSEIAIQSANSVNLQDYDHLEPHRIFHASRLVKILEAYALYDPTIGYCQGMSDLLSPIITIIESDYQAFSCFIGFMKKARNNFRLDEIGIRRQLNLVSKIIKFKDISLFKHLEKLQAEDCFFVYRMVVVLFRRELTFDQTVCLWEVMWADQVANRVGLKRVGLGPIRLDPPPTDDLLLYAIAASVLQKRKVIIESYDCMDEIIRDCNGMAGKIDVWRLLDDAHDLVDALRDRVE
ncbi:hypothetical protein LUZ60_014722 [Juncus effusus]|nr:hypothetical protein LUZ60_014722 [Juncus effusus]